MNHAKLDLGLLRFQPDLRFRKAGKDVFIFDPIRDKFLIKNDEEVVRQLTVRYLEVVLGWPRELIAVEKMLVLTQLERRKRFDILCHLPNAERALLVECKAPEIPLSFDTFKQLSDYNLALQVPYLMVTNGIDSYCSSIDFAAGTFDFLPAVPTFASLKARWE